MHADPQRAAVTLHHHVALRTHGIAFNLICRRRVCESSFGQPFYQWRSETRSRFGRDPITPNYDAHGIHGKVASASNLTWYSSPHLHGCV